MQERPLLELALETSEVFVDQLIDNPLAKEIPVVGSALKICKAFDNVRNRIFAAKLATFINTISSADEDIRSKWRDRTSSSPEECARIGSFLLVVIEQTNDLRKAEIFGLCGIVLRKLTAPCCNFFHLSTRTSNPSKSEGQTHLRQPHLWKTWTRSFRGTWSTQS